MQVFDNFLPNREFGPLQEAFLAEDFPWFYNPRVIAGQTNPNLYQMCHSFYMNWEWQSQYRNLVAPVLNRLDILTPLRIKANLTFKMDDNYESGWHHDYEAAGKIQDHNTAIFYVTTSNGPTLFEDSKVECVENRLVLFKNKDKHCGTYATDAKERVVINFNFLSP
ncbi:hypothetical protein CPPG_00106 [Cyanophage P-RSM1]|uniref:DNA endonuclease V n=1 Tax=Cyanophage P-RSM1 TaxID=536444 RepID=M4QE00_9CAUD|nr:DNA endonuclease V [Cyanophage P-RSM1]AGH26423.1 hypothetical protein CPPG_00106 [Cyanophage P-RSM1]